MTKCSTTLFTIVLLIATVSCTEQSTPPLTLEDGKYTLVWNDEFSTEGKPDTAKWSYEIGFVRNQELQWYQPDNARCEKGILIIEGRREVRKNPEYDTTKTSWRHQRQNAEYTSSCVHTRGKMSFLYGIMEVRAKIDTSMGMWPAIWTLGADKGWPANGEIDVMEFYRIQDTPTILANAAWADGDRKSKWDDMKIPLDHFTKTNNRWSDEYHLWRLTWTEDTILLHLDGELLNTIDLTYTLNPDGFNPFHQPHYVLLNLAIGANGGDPSTTTFPRNYQIDYVRIYQEERNLIESK